MGNQWARPIEAGELRVGTEADGLVQELMGPLDHLFSSQGKQLRCALVQRSAKAGPDVSAHAVREGATAIELLHLGTLAHDDVVDDGRLRRGSETVGVAYGHRASAFAGGVLVAAAAKLISRHGQEATKAFADAISKICAGEMAEVEDLFDADRSIERYLQAVAGKTAAGFAFAGWMGAWLGGADEHVSAQMGRFGHELGMAFQILDDTQDLCTSATETGKQRGKDLQQGVYTLPVLHAVLVDPLLRHRLGQPLEEQELEALVERVVLSGGVDRAEAECRSFIEKAKAAVDAVPDIAREPLLELLDIALEPLGELTLISSPSLEKATYISAYDAERSRGIPRNGRNLSFIGRVAPVSSSNQSLSSSAIKDCEFLRSVAEVEWPDDEWPWDRIPVKLGPASRKKLAACAKLVRDEFGSPFPFATNTLLQRAHGVRGPVATAVLVSTASAFKPAQSPNLAKAAMAAESLVPLASLISEVNDDRRGKVVTVNNGLAILVADFSISRGLRAAAQIGPSATARFAYALRHVCEGGMIDSVDRFDLDRTEERALRALELRVGAVFSLATAFGAQLTGQSEKDILTMSRFGSELGVAYALSQTMGDLTGSEIDASSLAAEFRQGIYSLPVLVAAKANGRVRKTLIRGIEKDDVNEFVDTVRQGEGLDRTLEHVVTRVERARQAVSDGKISCLPNLLSLLDQVIAGTLTGSTSILTSSLDAKS